MSVGCLMIGITAMHSFMLPRMLSWTGEGQQARRVRLLGAAEITISVRQFFLSRDVPLFKYIKGLSHDPKFIGSKKAYHSELGQRQSHPGAGKQRLSQSLE